ncbi:MAG: hypothetical protein ACPGWR_30710 [Ardenticatenaceae bacterium]
MSKKKLNKRKKKAALRQKKAKWSRDQEAKRKREAEAKSAHEEATRQLFEGPPLSKPKPLASNSPWLAAKPNKRRLDPNVAALNKRFDEFQAEKDYEARIALFIKTMDEGLMDEENAFHMLTQINQQSLQYGNEGRDRLGSLVALLRERLPDVYEHDAQDYVKWLVSNAFATNRLEDLPQLADDVATIAGQDLETFYDIVHQFAYHSQPVLVARLLRKAYPYLQGKSDNYPYSTAREFPAMAITYEILAYMEQHPTADVTARLLRKRVAYYADGAVNWDNIGKTVDDLNGRANSEWTMADFGVEGKPPSRDFNPDYREMLNIVHFTMQFLRYLRYSEGISYSKGEQAREMIHQYLLRRQACQLEPTKSGKRTPNRKQVTSRQAHHFFVPDAQTLDRYFSNLINSAYPQLYSMATFYQLLPAWLRYLESHHLIDGTQRDQTLDELREMNADVLKTLSRYTSEPALLEETKNAF